MSAVPKPHYTPAEYLAIERASEFRHEYYRGEMFQMAGATFPHVRILNNIVGALREALKGTTCYPLSTDMRVKVPETGLYTYADVTIVCGPPELEDNILDTLLNPRVIFEILSPSTETYDRGAKFKQYRNIETLQEYIIVCQNHVGAEQFVRQTNGSWNMTPLDNTSDHLKFTCVNAAISLTDIYEGVTLPELE